MKIFYSLLNSTSNIFSITKQFKALLYIDNPYGSSSRMLLACWAVIAQKHQTRRITNGPKKTNIPNALCIRVYDCMPLKICWMFWRSTLLLDFVWEFKKCTHYSNSFTFLSSKSDSSSSIVRISFNFKNYIPDG